MYRSIYHTWILWERNDANTLAFLVYKRDCYQGDLFEQALQELGAGFKYVCFNFSPRKLGENIPNLTSMFSKLTPQTRHVSKVYGKCLNEF